MHRYQGRDRRSSGCSLLFFFQAEDGIRDYKVTGVQTCALPISVHPDPTVGTDPFGPAADVRMPAGDDQRDVLRILARDAVLGAGVPERVAGREVDRKSVV